MLTIEEKTFRVKLLSRLEELVETQKELIDKILEDKTLLNHSFHDIILIQEV